ncbi:MAG: TA system antitoxin ParD family protein [Burkholderiales bacterium]
MSVPIRISDELFDAAKAVGKTQRRSAAKQIEYWTLIGKTALNNPSMTIKEIEQLLKQEETA